MDEAPQDSGTRRARERVGSVLKEKWRLDALLGVGGMAAVYAATHRNGKRVAIKMMHAELSANAEVKQRFLREGYLANAVDHPGAVSVMDDDVADDGSVFLVMELLDGETLERRWARKGHRLPVVEVMSIANQLLDVLAAAHAKGIVHRDIKPENVFLTREGQIKVLDFGIARIREVQASDTATKHGATMGTPAFMPPEQARGRWDEVDARSDVWAVGASMFALLAGRFVHEAETLNEQLLAAMTTPPQPIAKLVAELPPEIAAVIDRALAYKKDERWPDAKAMQAAIVEAYGASLSDASLSIPAAPRTSSADDSIAVAPFGSTSSKPSHGGMRSRPEIVTTARGLASAPSAAPPESTLRSAGSPRRAPLIVGASATLLGVVIAIVAWVAMRSPGPPVATTATAPIPTSVVVAPLASDESLARPADQVPVGDVPAPPGTGTAAAASAAAAASETASASASAMASASAATSPLAARTNPAAPRPTATASPPKHNPLLDRRH